MADRRLFYIHRDHLGSSSITTDGTGELKHFTDHLGSSNVVTDATGNVVQVSDYYPYGTPRISQKSDGELLHNRKQFTAKELDGTGLSYFGARYYDAKIARFTHNQIM